MAREHSTLDVAIGADGHLFNPHIIFAGVHIMRGMIPDKSKVADTLISATEKGYQNGASLLATIKYWDQDLVRRQVPKPIVWCTDGHASRLNLFVVRWCRENQWLMYLSPPHTTGIHQPLDQIFKSWHTTFNKIVARWCQEHVGKELARSTFAALFSEAWPKWTTPENILAAFRHCGISASGLNPDAIPAVKFILSETMKASSSTTDRAAAEHATALSLAQQATSSGAGTSTQPHTRAQTAEPADAPTPSRYLPLLAGEWKSPSPDAAAFPDKQKVEYWKEKQRLTSKMGKLLFHGAKELQHTPLTLKDTHPAWQPKKKSPEADKARDRQYLTKGVWGDVTDITGTDLEARLDQQEADKADKEERAQARAAAQGEKRKERERERAEKESEEAERRTSEEPLLALAKRLGFAAVNDEDMSTKAFGAFVKSNKALLGGLGVDTKSVKRASLAPLIVAKLPAPEGTQWVSAPLLALMPPPASPAATATVVAVHTAQAGTAASPVPAAVPLAPVAVHALLSSAQNHADEPPEKRARTEVSA